MKYDFLTQDERKQIREVRQQTLLTDLRGIELEHYQREIDYRLASRLTPPDQARMDAARAAQATLDARYVPLRADLDAIKGG